MNVDLTALPPVLTVGEIKEITRCRTRRKIIEVLNQLGIPYRMAGDGYPVVSRIACEQALGANIATKAMRKPQLHLS